MAIPWHCPRHSLLRRILWQCHTCCADLPMLFLQHPREDYMMLYLTKTLDHSNERTQGAFGSCCQLYSLTEHSAVRILRTIPGMFICMNSRFLL